MRPNKKDLVEWEELCEWLSTQPRKASYFIKVNDHLINGVPAIEAMRKWMKENNLDLVFWGRGYGWRLRKDWKKRIEQMKADLETQ